MAFTEPSEMTDESWRRAALVFKIVGVSDVVLGVVVAIFGPYVLGADPTITALLIAIGGLLAVSGLGIYWWGNRRFAVAQDQANAPAVVRTRR